MPLRTKKYNMAKSHKEIDLSKIPYQHQEVAANLLISKAKKLADFADLYLNEIDSKQVSRARQAVSLYDMALNLMKPYSGNYQTIIHWKCLTLIALEQYEEATYWYNELIKLAIDSEGPNYRNPTAKEAKRQLEGIKGKKNVPLPDIEDQATLLLDNPPFCSWASQFCLALESGKYKLAHEYLSSELALEISQDQLKDNWVPTTDNTKEDIDIILERYELASKDDEKGYVGWCYFVLSGPDLNEAVAVEIYQDSGRWYEIRSIEFGRP